MGRSLDFTELSGGLDLESALIYDAVHLLAVSLRQLRYYGAWLKNQAYK